MAMIIQPDQPDPFWFHGREDGVAMPAETIEIILAKGLLGRATKIQLVKLHPKEIGHAHRLGHGFGGVALARARHTVIDLGQQNNLGRETLHMRSSVFRKQAPFDVPGHDRNAGRQRRALCRAPRLQRVHRWDLCHQSAMRRCRARRGFDPRLHLCRYRRQLFNNLCQRRIPDAASNRQIAAGSTEI